MQLRILYQINNKYRDIFRDLLKAIDDNPNINEAINQDFLDQTG